jgi:hypothetical protein
VVVIFRPRLDYSTGAFLKRITSSTTRAITNTTTPTTPTKTTTSSNTHNVNINNVNKESEVDLFSRKRKRTIEIDEETLQPLEIGVYADIDWDRIRALKRMCQLNKELPEAERELILGDYFALPDIPNDLLPNKSDDFIFLTQTNVDINPHNNNNNNNNNNTQSITNNEIFESSQSSEPQTKSSSNPATTLTSDIFSPSSASQSTSFSSLGS